LHNSFRELDARSMNSKYGDMQGLRVPFETGPERGQMDRWHDRGERL